MIRAPFGKKKIETVFKPNIEGLQNWDNYTSITPLSILVFSPTRPVLSKSTILFKN